MNIINKKNWFFLISAAIIIPGIISLILFRLNFGIDFAGGSLWELKFGKEIDTGKIGEVIRANDVELASIQKTSEASFLLRLRTIDQQTNKKITEQLNKEFGQVTELRFETVGPTISKELTENAFKAVGLSLLGIIVYITWAFRNIPKEVSSFRFGVSAIIALIHDVLVVVGAFSIFGHFFKVEIDSLFVTALLTVIGFSVHDTIVVFDRVRENLIKHPGREFTQVVNDSILQTLGRSLATSLTVVFVLVALLLFGGTTIRWFVVALLIGIVSGTYSSIFNAAPILVVWQNWIEKRRK